MVQPRVGHALRALAEHRRTGIVETALLFTGGLLFKTEQAAESKRSGFASGMHFDIN
jgi:hypothetical protein